LALAEDTLTEGAAEAGTELLKDLTIIDVDVGVHLCAWADEVDGTFTRVLISELVLAVPGRSPLDMPISIEGLRSLLTVAETLTVSKICCETTTWANATPAARERRRIVDLKM
jgi:hypothetical protein